MPGRQILIATVILLPVFTLFLFWISANIEGKLKCRQLRNWHCSEHDGHC